MGSVTALVLLASVNMSAVPGPRAGAVVEQSAIGLMGAAVCGFVAGELAWIAGREDTTQTYPLNLVPKQRLAVPSAYLAGVPAGAALGVHLSGLVVGRTSAYWPKWVGAELATLAAGGVSLLILSQTNADTVNYDPYLVDRPMEVLAAVLPVAASVAGAFAGEALAARLGWAAAGNTPVLELGLAPAQKGLALACGFRLSF